MKKTLFAASALALVMSGSALAQSTFIETQADDQMLASEMLGTSVYGSGEQDAERIGEINDALIGQDDKLVGVIVGVGGFLGIGEKKVAVQIDQLEMTTDSDGDPRWVLSATKEDLDAAPTFRTREAVMAQQQRDAAQQQTAQTSSETGQAAQPQSEEQTAQTSEQPAMDENQQQAQTSEQQSEQPAQVTVLTPEQPSEQQTEQQMAQTSEQPAMDQPEQQAQTSEQPAQAETDADVTTTTTATDSDMPFVRPQLTREGYMDIPVAELTAEDLQGARVYGSNDEDIGEINDLVLNESGQVTDAIIDVGGFLGLGEKQVSVNFEQLQILRQSEGGDLRVYIEATEEQLDALPEYQAG